MDKNSKKKLKKKQKVKENTKKTKLLTNCKGSFNWLMKNQLALFAWSDTKVNFMLGTWPGIQTDKGFASEIERKKKNVTEKRACPKIGNVYNEHMGGIDLHDAHRSRISTHLRSKKMVDSLVLWLLGYCHCKFLY